MNADEKRDKYNDPFPTRLRDLMKNGHVTQQALAEAIGVKRQTISAYSDGSADPTLPKLTAIASFFGKSVDYLIGNHECKTPDNEMIYERIGLTDGAISALENYIHGVDSSFTCAIPSLISAILETYEGQVFIEHISQYIFADFDRVYNADLPFGEDTAGMHSIMIDIAKSTQYKFAGLKVDAQDLADAFLLKVPSMIMDLRKVIQKGGYGARLDLMSEPPRNDL